jgi:hypothetical protein
MRLAVVLLYTAGLRRGELLRLTLADVDADQGVVRIRESKSINLEPFRCRQTLLGSWGSFWESGSGPPEASRRVATPLAARDVEMRHLRFLQIFDLSRDEPIYDLLLRFCFHSDYPEPVFCLNRPRVFAPESSYNETAKQFDTVVLVRVKLRTRLCVEQTAESGQVVEHREWGLPDNQDRQSMTLGSISRHLWYDKFPQRYSASCHRCIQVRDGPKGY